MNSTVTAEQFFELLSTIMHLDARALPRDASRDTVEAWDSLTHMYIIQGLEDEFGISFSDVEIYEIASLSDLISAFSKKTGARVVRPEEFSLRSPHASLVDQTAL